MSMTEGGGRNTQGGSNPPSSSSRPQMDLETIMARQRQTSLIPAELTTLVMSRASQYPLPTPQSKGRNHTWTTKQVVEPDGDRDRGTQSSQVQAGVGQLETIKTKERGPSLDSGERTHGPAYPAALDVVVSQESPPASSPNPTSDVTSTSVPIPAPPSAHTSVIVRAMVHLFSYFFVLVKITVGPAHFVLATVAPPIATVYIGSLICESLRYPYYAKRWDSILIVPGIFGAFLALVILYPISFIIPENLAMFGPPPLRVVTSKRNSTTKTVPEDQPNLFLYYPLFYLYSFFSLVLVARIGPYPSGDDPKVFLTVQQIARVAALGALPVSLIHFIVLPFSFGIWQWTRRGVDGWVSRMTGIEEKEHDDSVLRMVCYQYAYWWRRLRGRRRAVDPRGDGLA